MQQLNVAKLKPAVLDWFPTRAGDCAIIHWFIVSWVVSKVPVIFYPLPSAAMSPRGSYPITLSVPLTGPYGVTTSQSLLVGPTPPEVTTRYKISPNYPPNLRPPRGHTVP